MVAMSFDLATTDPYWLSQIPDLKEILEAVNTVEEWSEHLAQILDFTYRVRVTHALRIHASSEDLQALVEHMEEVAHHPRRKKIFETMELRYASRWRAMYNLLEDLLATRELAIPDSVKNRPYVREILQLLQWKKQCWQKELIDEFDIKEANLSRILGMMERWEVLIRHKEGRDNLVTLGPRADEILPCKKPLAPKTQPSKCCQLPGHSYSFTETRANI